MVFLGISSNFDRQLNTKRLIQAGGLRGESLWWTLRTISVQRMERAESPITLTRYIPIGNIKENHTSNY